MKYLIVILFTFSVFGAEKSDVNKWCIGIHDISTSIMVLRQNNIDMPTVLKTADNELTTTIIIKAYKYPHFSTTKMQQKTIKDFANDQMVHCLKVNNDE